MHKYIKYLFSSQNLSIILCTSLMLLFLGAFFLFAISSNKIVQTLKKESEVWVEFENDTPGRFADSLRLKLEEFPSFIPNSFNLLPKEQAVTFMQSELGDNYLIDRASNPFYDVLNFRVINTVENHLNIKGFLESIPSIQFVEINIADAEGISKNLFRARTIFLFVGLFFFILALIMIFNAIKLTIAESKNGFQIMKLLGADPYFIKKPFLQRSFYIGLISFLITIVPFYMLFLFVKVKWEFTGDFIRTQNLIITTLILFIAGMAINLISTSIVLQRFLLQKEEE